jgi:hypothetical protein
MCRGNWREVHLVGDIAVKVPRSDRPELAAGGRRLNLFEWELWHCWQPRYGWDYLCPAVSCSQDGGELVMQAVVPCVAADEPELRALWRDIEDRYRYVSLLGECKWQDWGRLERRFVLFDYGAECDTAADVEDTRATLVRYVGMAKAERRVEE